jgi:hypothetical protein
MFGKKSDKKLFFAWRTAHWWLILLKYTRFSYIETKFANEYASDGGSNKVYTFKRNTNKFYYGAYGKIKFYL